MMRRREFVQKLGVGSAATALAASGAVAKTREVPQGSHEREGHDHRPVRGALATATVSFGQWRTDVPLDRYPLQLPGPPPGNGHLVIPHEVTIKVGGTVNFIIAGFHQVIVYAPGTEPDDINVGLVRPTQGVPLGPPLINDPHNRLYAGEDPSTVHFTQSPTATTAPFLDRVEVVQFSRRGRHLVICGVFPHFVNDNMYGWVRVVGEDE
jgi:plastocyanin